MERCKKKYSLRNALLTLLAVMCYASTANAVGPMWTYEPLTARQVDVPKGSVGLVSYLVTNQSRRPMNLVLVSTPGLSQVGPCVLTPKGQPGSNCTFSISIDGSALPDSGIHDGPKICQANSDGIPNLNQCYQPERADIVDITTSPDLCPSVSAQYGLGIYHVELPGTFSLGLFPIGAGDYEIKAGNTKCERIIEDLWTYPELGFGTQTDFEFTFNADGTITYPVTSLRIWCGVPPVFSITPSSIPSTYDAVSDASFDINVLIDETSCASGSVSPGVMELRRH
ncbi:MAG: hypothetical protein P1U36_06140 [Legionellaceae bacterium]|nr:hypothetical protein [Legionellaceae bacterium]